MLFLLLGFTAVLLLGFWLAGSFVPTPQEAVVVSGTPPPDREGADWTLIWTLIVASWATAFLQRPFWLSLLLSVAIAGFGALLVVGGAVAGYADSYLRPGDDSNWALFWCGVAMVASRLVTLYLWLRKHPEELLP